MVAFSSKDSVCGSKDSVDWRLNHVLLPPRHERSKCKCECAAIIDTWEYDGTDRVGRHYFKCLDLDPYFMV
jgi:hypothetical protein